MTPLNKTAVQDALDLAVDYFDDTYDGPGSTGIAIEAAVTAFLADLPEDLLLVVAERAREAKAEELKQRMLSGILRREREAEERAAARFSEPVAYTTELGRLSAAHTLVQTTRNARVAEPLRDIVNAFSRGTAQEDDDGP